MAKTFRIFLSSTFGDFQAEREALKAKVFPVLESRCREKGAAFEVVDLRWGVSEADGLSHDTLRICLDEVAACRLLSPRPNFVMLIGDRYGWRPLPAEIPVDEFEPLLAARPNDRQLLQAWYRRDDNAEPPHYRLLPRGDAYRDYAAWGKVESSLTQVMRDASKAAGMTQERRELYFLSATHLEIVKGTLSVPDAPEHVFSFFRDIDGLDLTRGPAGRFTDLVDGKSDPEAQTLRGELRTEIRAKLPADHCFDYRCKWTGDITAPLTTGHITKLCADVQQALLAQIDHELQDTGGDALAQEIERHTKFAEDHTAGFIGRTDELAQLMAWADAALKSSSDASSPPVLVHAPGGSGKSSFMAKGIAEIKARHQDAVILTRFVGTTPDSIELISLLRGLLIELARKYDQPEDLPEGGLKELIDALPERLAWASPEKPLMLVLDALDQIAPGLETREHRWLPVELPPCVALMLSVLDGKVQEAACRRFAQATQIALPAFTREEGGTLLDALLLAGEAVAPERKRCLTPAQRQAVLDAFDHDGRPLYLVLAAGIARHWHSWQAPEHLPNTIETLIVEIVRRLHDTHGKAIADRALDYLCASRYGVSDVEMRDLLWRDEDAHAEFDKRKNPDQPDVDSLPPVIWSRIYSALAPWLATQNVGGSLLHRFFHRILGEEITKVSLADDAAVVHQRLADYFGKQDLRLKGKDSDSASRPNLRRLMEQPWQLTKAGLLQEAEALLTDFDFVMTKCEAGLVEDLLDDYLRLNDALEMQPQSARLKEWESFMQRNAHYLRRGTDLWPAHKILLQIAVEVADGSVITQAAEAWLKQGHCDWVWVRNKKRPTTKGHTPLLLVMEGHTGDIIGAQLLPDGRILSWGDTLRLWNRQSGAALAVMKGHANYVVGALLLPDGRILSWGDTLRLWDGQSGSALAVMRGHTEDVTGGLLLPDGRILSWSNQENSLRLWDGQTGAAQAVLDGHTETVHGALVLSDGRILSWSGDNTLRLWDGHSGEELAVLEGHTHSVDGSLILPDGRILSWSKDKTLRLWNGQTGAGLAVLEGHTSRVRGAMSLPDGRILSWCGGFSLDDHTLRLWDGQTGAALAVMRGHTDEVNGAMLLPDGRILSWAGKSGFSSKDKTLRLWDGQTGAALAVLNGHTQCVNGALLLPGGKILSWSCYEEVLRLWDAQTGAALAVIDGFTKGVGGALLLPDDKILSWGKTLRLLDVRGGSAPTTDEGHTEWIDEVMPLPDGRILSWSDDNTLRLWDGQTGVILAVMKGHTNHIQNVSFLPDGRILSWSDDRTLRLWDGQSGVPLVAMKGHTESVEDALVLPDGRILSRSWDKTLRLWDGQSGAALAVMKGHAKYVEGALALPDGRILSWSMDNTLRLWDGHSGATLAVLDGHTGSVSGALVLPDGRIMSWANSDDDNTLRLWNGQTGAALAVMEGHTNTVWSALVLPDGRILSWSSDGTLRLWDGQSGVALAVLRGHTDRIKGVLLLPNGRILSWAGNTGRPSLDKTLRLWDGQSGAPLAVMKGHTEDINGAFILPDGHILSWSIPDTLYLWDTHTGACLSTYRSPWSEEDINFPLPDGLRTKFAGRGLFGNVWGQSGDGHIRLANRTAGWQARWHGDTPKFRDHVADSWIASSGRHLLFLQLMRGNVPLEMSGGTKDNVVAVLNTDSEEELELPEPEESVEIEAGKIYDGTVLLLFDDGALVQILPGKNGLLPVSEIAHERSKAVADKLEEGQVIRVKVLEVDGQGQVRLSMKVLLEPMSSAPAEMAAQSTSSAPAPEASQASPSVTNDHVVLAKRKDAAFEHFLNKARSSVKDGSIFFAPNIPEKKVKNALGSYAPGVTPDDVLVLIDITTFGGAKDGLILTKDKIYLKELFKDPQHFALADVTSCSFKPAKLLSELWINDQKVLEPAGVDKDAVATFATLLNSLCGELRRK